MIRHEGITVLLPTGVRHDGQSLREARLRTLRGCDEFALSNPTPGLTEAHRATALLSYCVTELGESRRVTQEAIQSLTVGDREALLLQLRRLTYGEEIQCVLNCAGCKERLDVSLRVADLLRPAYPWAAPWHERAIGQWHVRFRLPTGADQEAAGLNASRLGIEGAAEALIRSCVMWIHDGEGAQIEESSWPREVLLALPSLMAELDPQAEVSIVTPCASCGRRISGLFDAFGFLCAELEAGGDLLHDVHLLASYYHWSEWAILALPTQRRRAYLALRRDAVSGGGR